MNQIKTVVLSKETYDRLRALGAYGDTMTDIVDKLLTYAPQRTDVKENR